METFSIVFLNYCIPLNFQKLYVQQYKKNSSFMRKTCALPLTLDRNEKEANIVTFVPNEIPTRLLNFIKNH